VSDERCVVIVVYRPKAGDSDDAAGSGGRLRDGEG